VRLIPRRHTNSKGIGIGAESANNKRIKFMMREVLEMQKKREAEKHELDVKFSKPNRPTKKKGKKK